MWKHWRMNYLTLQLHVVQIVSVLLFVGVQIGVMVILTLGVIGPDTRTMCVMPINVKLTDFSMTTKPYRFVVIADY